METVETFGDLLGSIVDEQIKKINTEKEKLLKLRVEQLIGSEIDLVKECKKKFPRIIRCVCKDSPFVTTEEYWWNDGTEMGKCLISFLMPNITITPFKSSSPFEGGQIKVVIEYK